LRAAFNSTNPGRDRIFARGTALTTSFGQSDDIIFCIAHEKRLKRWRRAWKFALIEQGNPEWRDLYGVPT
jgi:predicted GIY-YIG superfamily endonuclease